MRPHAIRCLQAGLLVVTAACISDPASEVGELSSALTPVTWTDVVGVSASGNDLTKTAPETTFNAGAVSVQTLAGDGFVEFTTGESTSDKLAGLSVGNGGQGYKDIDFAIRLNASGHASIYEGGVNRGGIGVYAAGDLFRVQADNGAVTYWRNGKLKYTSALAPSFPLLVDTSLKTPGATLRDVSIKELDVWTSPVGVTAAGDDITKTAPEDTFNAGAISLASIPSGDGYAEFRAEDAVTQKAAGLSHGNSNASRTDIDFAISLREIGAVQVYEAGTLVGNFGLYHAGDTFQVQVTGGVVTYLHNRVPFYTSAVAPIYPLLLDASIRTPGASILDARLVAGYSTLECAPAHDSLLAPGPEFSTAIDAAGDLLVWGDQYATPPVARVYRKTTDGWTLEQTLTEPVGRTEQFFAARVATDGETIAVGVGGIRGERGYVQLYRNDGAQWVEEDLVGGCPDGQSGLADFDVRGDVLATGEAFEDRVHVFRRDGAGSWNTEAILTAPVPSGFYGERIALGGDRLFVGDSRQNTEHPGGAIYVYRHTPTAPDPPQPPSCSFIDPGKWRLRSTITPSSPADHLFGRDEMDVNATGTRLLVGDGREDAHVLDLSAGVWTESALLLPYPDEFFGEFAALGGPNDDVAAIADSGGSWIYGLQGSTWTELYYNPEAATAAATSDTVFFNDASDTGPAAVLVLDVEPACLAE